jgi:hypothetical protein
MVLVFCVLDDFLGVRVAGSNEKSPSAGRRKVWLDLNEVL